jgi:hypothetical protein
MIQPFFHFEGKRVVGLPLDWSSAGTPSTAEKACRAVSRPSLSSNSGRSGDQQPHLCQRFWEFSISTSCLPTCS